MRTRTVHFARQDHGRLSTWCRRRFASHSFPMSERRSPRRDSATRGSSPSPGRTCSRSRANASRRVFPMVSTASRATGSASCTRKAQPTPRGPQVGGHYFIIPSLSLGATLGYEARVARSPSRLGNRGIVTQDTDNTSTFVFVPKVGYALMFNDVIGFWFRGGPGFFRVGTTDATDTRIRDSDTFWLLSLDAFFVVSPVQHVGFYVGPQADISFTGSAQPHRQQRNRDFPKRHLSEFGARSRNHRVHRALEPRRCRCATTMVSRAACTVRRALSTVLRACRADASSHKSGSVALGRR